MSTGIATATASPAATVESRFVAAAAEVRQRGIIFTPNVMSCCRSCATAEDLGLGDGLSGTVPHAWTFGGQGKRLEFDQGRPVRVEDPAEIDDECSCTEDEWGEDEDGEEVVLFEGETCRVCRYGVPEPRRTPARGVHVYHGGPKTLAANVVAEVFAEHGFTVEWDKTTAQSVQIVF